MKANPSAAEIAATAGIVLLRAAPGLAGRDLVVDPVPRRVHPAKTVDQIDVTAPPDLVVTEANLKDAISARGAGRRRFAPLHPHRCRKCSSRLLPKS